MFIIMNDTTLILLALAVVVAIQTKATKVSNCDGKPIADATVVTLTNCDEPPCRLKKGAMSGITQKFTPDHDIVELVTKASATVMWNFRKSYPGVDDTSACDKIYLAVDNSPAPCPLKKGVEYVYKNELFVSSWYPSMSTNVRWALQEHGIDITCFQVDAELFS